jgi:membrane dipeptidase
MSLPPVIDGHNDVLLRIRRSGGNLLERTDEGHLDVPRAREAGVAAGFFAVFVPGDDRIDWAAVAEPPYELPLSPPIDADRAALEAAAMADLLVEAQGPLSLVRTAADLERCLAGGPRRARRTPAPGSRGPAARSSTPASGSESRSTSHT